MMKQISESDTDDARIDLKSGKWSNRKEERSAEKLWGKDRKEKALQWSGFQTWE